MKIHYSFVIVLVSSAFGMLVNAAEAPPFACSEQPGAKKSRVTEKQFLGVTHKDIVDENY